MGGYAWVTLATNDAYSLGALVLAHSLRRVGTRHELAVLITPGVTEMMREKLRAVFNLVQEVNVLDSKDKANLALLARPELGITFTKLHCWRLTQYEKCVFVDADTLVVRNCDELFDREELSAAPDVGWPDCFNSGVFVFKPSQETFASITAFAASKGSFDGGDQGLLNMYFKDWAHKDISKHLPFIYNMCSTATYSYLPAFKQFGEDVRIIHFIGVTKPWLQYFDTMTGIVQPPMGSAHLQPLLQLWWNIFCDNVHPQLSAAMATSTLAPIWHNFPRPRPSNQSLPYYPLAPRNPVHYDANYENYERYSDIYIEAPDFTEFKDPWENYSPRDDPFINDVRQNGSGEWSGYSSVTDYAPKPADVQQEHSHGDQSMNTCGHMCNVQEMVEYHGHTCQPQHRHSQVSNHEHKAQQTETCLSDQNIGQTSESRQERWKPEVSIEQHNGHQEERHDVQIQHGYYTQYERPEEHHERHHYEHQDCRRNEQQHHVQHQDQHCNQHHHHAHQDQHNIQHHHHAHQDHHIQQHYHAHQDQHHIQQHFHAHQDQHHIQERFHAHQDQHHNQQHHHTHQDHHNQQHHHAHQVHHNQLHHHAHQDHHNQQHHHAHQDHYNQQHHHAHQDHHNQHHHTGNHQDQHHHKEQHHHFHHHDQHHHHDHIEHHHHRHDHQTHQQFPSSIVKHGEHKQETMADHESHFSDHEQNSQHMDNRIDESHCQRTSESSEDHKVEQFHDAHHQSEHTHSRAKQTDVQRTESYPVSEPCTDLRNVATQSDPNITGDSLNAGLPGALAQMTLGQPRSAEQIALEEHMRKQSWEQGQIDYMGRDSFDNIWKKICETLSLAPQRQPTPPKEIPKTDESTAESKVQSVDDTDAPAKTAKEATDSTEQIQTCKVPTTENIVPPAQAIDKEAADAPAAEQDVKDKLETVTAKQEIEIDSKKCEMCPTQKPVALEQTPSIPTTPVCQISGAPVCPLVLPVKKEDTIVQETEASRVACALSKPDVTQPRVQESSRAESAAEGEEAKKCEPCATTDVTCPVPIQVAESVLQAEPKESVSEEPRPITEEIVSSVEIPVQESVAALSVKPMEPMTSSATCVLRQESTSGQANGSLSADALAKLQSVDPIASPTTVASTAVTVETKPGSEEVCPIPVREAPKSETETGTRTETASATAEVKEEVTKVQTPKTEAAGQAGTVCTLRTETATGDLPKSEVLASETQPEASKTETATPVVEVPKCELPKPQTAITGTSFAEMPKSEGPKTDVTAPATPIAKPPKCELPVTKATPEPTPIAELPKPESLKSGVTPAIPTAEAPKPESLKSEVTPAIPAAEAPKPESLKSEVTPAISAAETPKLEPLKAEASSTPVTEVLKCELSATKDKQATAVKPSKTETPATPVTEAPKCELPPATVMQPAVSEGTQQVPTVEPTKPEPIKCVASKPPTKPQEAPKPDPLKIPAPMPDTPPSDSSKSTSPKTPESPSETPVRPTRTKEITIPATPTVTEPTPPTSPPITGDPLDLEAQTKTKKTTKKVLKKSASECESGDGAEGDSEKKTKKTVKKVTKKSKESQEEGAESSGAEKPKKTTKVVKKIAKPAQTLGADPSVPETPPPGSSDAPVPPKRKTKSATTTKSSTPGKKPDEP